jgi:hypothetical protein
MYSLKPLSQEARSGALSKAERYRLLNEPWQAESICRDILAVDSGNQAAIAMLILSLTDQFSDGVAAQLALDVVRELADPYERAYYSGIVHERRAIAMFRHSDYRSGEAVYALLRHAMEWYDKAEELRPPGNDDAVLRWNACVRFLQKYPQLDRGEDLVGQMVGEPLELE